MKVWGQSYCAPFTLLLYDKMTATELSRGGPCPSLGRYNLDDLYHHSQHDNLSISNTASCVKMHAHPHACTATHAYIGGRFTTQFCHATLLLMIKLQSGVHTLLAVNILLSNKYQNIELSPELAKFFTTIQYVY